MENDDNYNSSDDNNTKWLGFSLSPQLTMEVPSGPSNHHRTHPPPDATTSVSSAIPPSFSHSQPHLNDGIYHGSEGENAGLYSPLPMMPLKYDKSLFIMEALSKSQG